MGKNKSRVSMKVDFAFHELFKRKSEDTGLAVIDLTRLVAKQSVMQQNKVSFVVKKKKKTRRGDLFQLEGDDEFLQMFR